MNKEKLQNIIEKAQKTTGFGPGDIGFALIDDEEIRKLNKQYRGKDSATDVLSFAYSEGEKTVQGGGERQIGDIFISLDTAKKQAEEKGHSLKKELEILLVHGLLHLFGYDHQNDEREAEMEKMAAKILED